MVTFSGGVNVREIGLLFERNNLLSLFCVSLYLIQIFLLPTYHNMKRKLFMRKYFIYIMSFIFMNNNLLKQLDKSKKRL